MPSNPGRVNPVVTSRFERWGSSVPVCDVMRLSASGMPEPSAKLAR
jgi:hypothetical protein